ncbi:outer membrane protein assembly factor BamB [Flavobacterium arsenatis]|uniref:Outer membrane protein assembly factor BamB n=1 Tax=Flavobacterium arsenatis TaxID=1484332 RepID=A0ABU1TUR4_9FLAO|nr:PQQ-binding-like beta-propeller repeat protein [Flavobacterium arsenatis]MDR6969595.1 outer membrane protein assembly factor BamB [Flavobacterium arsenatis]
MIKLFFLGFLLLLFSCNNSNSKEEQKFKTLYLTTNANDVYVFDIESKKIKWHYPGFNLEVNDEVNFFSLDDKTMTKVYQDGTVIQFDKSNGTILHKFQDKEDESQSYYGYDFADVEFLLFYQYPIVYQGNVLFANSHGEIKSVNIQTQKQNWVYIQPQIIYSSPKVLNNILYANINHKIIALDVKTGKKLFDKALDDIATNELMIDGDKIYILSQNNTLACYNLKLETEWICKVESTNQSSTHNLLITEKAVYFGGSTLYSVDKKTGKINWQSVLNDENSNPDNLLSVIETNKGIMVMTENKFLNLDKKGKITTSKKNTETPMGMLYHCNQMNYYLTQKGNLYRIDNDLKKEELFYKGITIDPNHRVDNTYLYAD